MNNVYFKNSRHWLNVYATLLTKDEKEKVTIKLSRKNRDKDKDYVVEFDNSKYDHLYFHNSIDEKKKTSKIFVGNSTIGCRFKYNRSQKRGLTYLYSKEDKITGRVDTYTFKDEVNLAYREDTEKKVHVFVPFYYEGNERYDVLYFFDSQNLFSNAGKYTNKNDPYGGWQLDVALNSIYNQYGRGG